MESEKAQKQEGEEFADKTAKKIIDVVGKPAPIQKIRSSALLSALLGTVGFAFFIVGIEDLIKNVAPIHSIILGLVIMIVSGVLFQRLSKDT